MRLHKAKHTCIIPTLEGDIEFCGGAVYCENEMRGYYPEDKKLQRSFDFIGDGPPDPPDWTSATKLELAEYAGSLCDWINGPVGQKLGWVRSLRPMIDDISGDRPREVTTYDLIVPLLEGLMDVAHRLGRPNRLDAEGIALLDETGALGKLCRIVEWATPPKPTPTGDGKQSTKKKAGRKSTEAQDKKIAEEYQEVSQ